MARFFPLIWTDPAIDDLDEIAAWIALDRASVASEEGEPAGRPKADQGRIDRPRAAGKLVKRVFAKVERLTLFPESGRRVPELPRDTLYREVVVPPCRVFYRMEGRSVLIVHVRRSERELDLEQLP